MGDFRLLDQMDSTASVESLREVSLGSMGLKDLVIFESRSNAPSQYCSEVTDILDGFDVVDPLTDLNKQEMDFDKVAELSESTDLKTGKTKLEIQLYGISDSDPFVKSVKEQTLDRIPNRIENFLAEEGQKLVLADKISSVSDKRIQYFATFPARNYTDGSTVGDLPAFYAPTGQIVGVMSCPQYELTGNYNVPTESQVANTAEKLIHETGHAVDNVLKLSDDPAFNAIYNRELAGLKASNVPNKHYFAGTTSEAVAELFAYYCEGDAHDTDGSSELAKTMPESYKWLAGKFDSIGKRGKVN